jgi:Na+-driven multidrug efflux pump
VPVVISNVSTPLIGVVDTAVVGLHYLARTASLVRYYPKLVRAVPV